MSEHGNDATTFTTVKLTMAHDGFPVEFTIGAETMGAAADKAEAAIAALRKRGWTAPPVPKFGGGGARREVPADVAKSLGGGKQPRGKIGSPEDPGVKSIAARGLTFYRREDATKGDYWYSAKGGDGKYVNLSAIDDAAPATPAPTGFAGEPPAGW